MQMRFAKEDLSETPLIWYTCSMADALTYFLLFFAVLIILFALSLFTKWKKLQQPAASQNQLRTQKDENGKTIFVRCPLCNTPLAKTENLTSTIYHPMNVPDQRMNISGCPHCYPVCPPELHRLCPVCGKTVPADGYLIARLFNKPGKKHVIVAGCAHCCTKKL